MCPTEHFKSEEAYRKWTAYRHIHGIAAPHLETAVVAGKAHKVNHSEKSGKPSKLSYSSVYEARKAKKK